MSPITSLAVLGIDQLGIDAAEVHPVLLPRPGSEPLAMVALMFRRADTGAVFWIPLAPPVAAALGLDLEHAALVTGRLPGTDCVT